MSSFLKYTLYVLLIGLILASYYRFMVLRDYYVAYEVSCDPHTQDCFIGCEDDACEVSYSYALIERKASVVYDLCGNDIIDCIKADFCMDDEPECNVTMCTPEVEECAISDVEDTSTEDEEEEMTTDDEAPIESETEEDNINV
jgi:hypothetical protein